MNNEQELANQLEERLLDFAVRIIRLTNALPKDEAGIHIAKQLLRSGTSPAPNYSEARGAESRADFIHKLGIVLKELNESKVWLKMITRAMLLPTDRLSPLIAESTELAKIIQASRKTLRSKTDGKNAK